MIVSLPAARATFLDEIDAGLDAVAVAVRREFEPLDQELLTRRPKPGAWSVAHCLDHLRHTNAEYRTRLAPALEEARRDGPSGGGRPEAGGTLRSNWFERWFVRWMAPGGGMAVKAPKIFQPDEEPAGSDAVQGFLEEQGRLRELVAEARGLPVDRIKFGTPVTALLRLRVSTAFALLLNHEVRHLEQARRACAGVRGSP